jgi:hypothetical protein
MRVVSLNLDHGDASVVRRALRLALDSCRCAEAGQPSCGDCKALLATLGELDRLVQRPALGRTPLLSLVAAEGRRRPAEPRVGDGRLNREAGFRLLAGDGGMRGNR